MNTKEVNSKKYWNYRFKEDWECNDGKEQTAFFTDLAIKNFPKWFNEDVKENNLSIMDFGCAEGQGTKILGELFKDSGIYGIDFSTEAIEKSKKYYPDCNFICSDLEKLDKKFDVIFCSNVLEHFKEPIEMIKKLLSRAEKYLVLMVPLQDENNIAEHSSIFNYDSFPLKIESFFLSYYREMDCRSIANTKWPGKQMLLIYGNVDKVDFEKIDLSSISENDNRYKEISKLLYELKEKDERIITLLSDISDIKDKHNDYVKTKEKEFSKTLCELNKIYSSTFWKVALKYYKLRDRSIFKYFFNLLRLIKNRGITNKVKKILNENKEKPVIIFKPLVDWNIPLFQRPQHIAKQLANRGFLYFYCRSLALKKFLGR